MNIGLIAPPFIAVPPKHYGGTELFLGHLAEALKAEGHHPIVYTVGESAVDCETRWRWAKGAWPLQSSFEDNLRDLEHTSWACHDAARCCDVIHLNSASGLILARFVKTPFVYTLHHVHERALSDYYSHFDSVQFVAISHRQARAEAMAELAVIQHGLNPTPYLVAEGKRDYLAFIGRIAPIKGVHTAIQVAKRSGIPLKIGGEIQPCFREYWENVIAPEVDGKFIEFLGELDLAGKNKLLAGARALLFPIEWEEPFGLVMIEAMACDVPVLAFAAGAAPEVVRNGVSGWVCSSMEDMATRALDPAIPPGSCRAYVEREFSLRRMARAYLEVYRRLDQRSKWKVMPLRLQQNAKAV